MALREGSAPLVRDLLAVLEPHRGYIQLVTLSCQRQTGCNTNLSIPENQGGKPLQQVLTHCRIFSSANWECVRVHANWEKSRRFLSNFGEKKCI